MRIMFDVKTKRFQRQKNYSSLLRVWSELREWKNSYEEAAIGEDSEHLAKKYLERAGSCDEVCSLIDQALRELVFVV